MLPRENNHLVEVEAKDRLLDKYLGVSEAEGEQLKILLLLFIHFPSNLNAVP